MFIFLQKHKIILILTICLILFFSLILFYFYQANQLRVVQENLLNPNSSLVDKKNPDNISYNSVLVENKKSTEENKNSEKYDSKIVQNKVVQSINVSVDGNFLNKLNNENVGIESQSETITLETINSNNRIELEDGSKLTALDPSAKIDQRFIDNSTYSPLWENDTGDSPSVLYMLNNDYKLRYVGSAITSLSEFKKDNKIYWLFAAYNLDGTKSLYQSDPNFKNYKKLQNFQNTDITKIEKFKNSEYKIEIYDKNLDSISVYALDISKKL